jgi:hypothetical protein
MRIYCCGSVFVLITLGLNPFLNAQGFSGFSMLTTIIGAVTNIILDPILMFGFRMGVAGAAYATVISQAVSATFVLWFLTKGKDIILGVSLAIKSVTGAVASIVNAILGKAEGGIVTAMGRSLAFASGGVISGGMARFLEGVPHYARGTTRAHGTLFVAGEAGPEIMGHINGRTEILNKSQLAQTMYGAVTSGMAAALRGLTFRMPAMATGGVMPYGVSAQIARTGLELQSTLDANNEDLIQTIISVIGAQTTAIVAALQAVERSAGGSGGALGVQSVINEINRRTQMFSASPLKGV